MRLVTFENPGFVQGSRAGSLTDTGDVVDLAEAANLRGASVAGWFASIADLIDGGEEAWDAAREATNDPPDAAIHPPNSVRLLAPLPRPRQVRCFSTFEKHGRQSAEAMMRTMAAGAEDPAAKLEELRASGRFEIPDVVYERPFYYKGNRMSVVGPDSEVTWPAYSNLVDYELELALVVGRRCVDVTASDAGYNFFGFTICNDLSARDEQAKDMALPLGPAKGKDFDGGLVMGPCIVTADEIADPYALEMIVRVNGEERGRGRSDDMLFSFEQLLAFVSRSETIHPGEILLSGCVGNGSGMEIGRFPVRGDTIELEITPIGRLSTRIV